MHVGERVKSFAASQDGAVTVDWVVLSAGVVSLGLLVVASVKPAIEQLGCSIAESVDPSIAVATGGNASGSGC